jgi:hypothetical protein
VQEDQEVVGEISTPSLAVMVSYTITIYTISQMKKDSKKHGEGKTTFLQLHSDIEWDTFMAKLLVKVLGPGSRMTDSGLQR